jgi:hypothetical protein
MVVSFDEPILVMFYSAKEMCSATVFSSGNTFFNGHGQLDVHHHDDNQ